jgi:hypothetical protein
MEEKLSHTEKYERVSEAADTLTNCDFERAGEDLLNALEALSEGTPFMAGCPEHIVGQKCKRCGWNGKLGVPRPLPALVEHDPPKAVPRRAGDAMTTHWTIEPGGPVVGSVGHRYFTLGDNDDVDKVRAALRREWWTRAERVVLDNDRYSAPPPRKPDEPEVPGVPGAEGLLDTEVVWMEFHPYGNKGTSRADRLSNALCALTSALDVLDLALEKLDRDDERVAEIDVESLRNCIGELEGIEFPGMYG